MNHRQTKVRFWVFWNGSWVKLTVKAGYPVVLSEYQSTDEGYDSTELTYSLVEDEVLRKQHRHAQDCDGPLETIEHRTADSQKLAVLETPDPMVKLPDWQWPKGCMDAWGNLIRQ